MVKKRRLQAAAGISPTMNEGILIEPLIDRDQLCLVLNMEPWVINQMRRDGVIPSVSFGPRRHRYRLSDVLKALAKLPEKEVPANG